MPLAGTCAHCRRNRVPGGPWPYPSPSCCGADPGRNWPDCPACGAPFIPRNAAGMAVPLNQAEAGFCAACIREIAQDWAEMDAAAAAEPVRLVSYSLGTVEVSGETTREFDSWLRDELADHARFAQARASSSRRNLDPAWAP